MTDANERLKEARQAAGYTSARAAALAHGWNVNTYKAHEAGLNGVSPAHAATYASTFGTKPAWLLYGEGEPPRPSAAPRQSRADLPPPEPIRAAPAIQRGNRDLPVHGVGVGGEDGRFRFNGEAIDYVERPPQLSGVPNAYAIFVSGDSMEPRYEPGQTVHIHPTRPPKRGDDVVVQLHPEHGGDPPEGYIKRFLGWTPSQLTLLQFNPRQEVVIDRALVKTIHVIVGSTNL